MAYGQNAPNNSCDRFNKLYAYSTQDYIVMVKYKQK